MSSRKFYNEMIEKFKNYKPNIFLNVDEFCDELCTQCFMIVKDTQYDLRTYENYIIVRIFKKDNFYIFCYVNTFEYLQDNYFRDAKNITAKMS